MFEKKIILAGMTAAVVFSLSVLPAFAHGHGHHNDHHGNTTQTVPNSNYNTGAVSNTDINAGADLSAGISVTADTNTNASTAAVPNVYPVCTFEDCTETGRHLHDGSYYCGYHHDNGYCDSSCTGSSSAAINSPDAGNSPASDNSPAVNGYHYGRRYGCHRSYARKLIYCH